jgi:hypothetical protein
MGKLPCDSCIGILRSHIRMDRFRRAFLLKASFGGRDLFRVQVTLVAHLMGMTPAFLTRNKLDSVLSSGNKHWSGFAGEKRRA